MRHTNRIRNLSDWRGDALVEAAGVKAIHTLGRHIRWICRAGVAVGTAALLIRNQPGAEGVTQALAAATICCACYGMGLCHASFVLGRSVHKTRENQFLGTCVDDSLVGDSVQRS